MNAGAAITVTIGAFLASGVNLFYRVPKYNQQERILHELAIMRTSGVTLRNQRPEEVFSAEKIEGWFMVWNAEIEMWHTKLYKEAYKFSPVEAERLRTLDTMPISKPRGVVDPEQLRTILYLSETLKRLDKMLEKRFRPTPSP